MLSKLAFLGGKLPNSAWLKTISAEPTTASDPAPLEDKPEASKLF